MNSAKSGRRAAVGACLALACLYACRGRRGDERRAVDLLALFPFTEAGQTVDRIEPGTVQSTAHLRGGWSAPGPLPTGEPGVWAVSRRATVQLVIANPANGRLLVRCGLLGSGAPPLSLLTVNLNGRRAGMFRVTRELAEHAVLLPASLQRRGPNLIEIMNPWLSDLPRSRERQLARAVAVSAIRLEGVNSSAGRPALLADAGEPRALLLPAGARVNFFVRLPDAAALAFDVEPQAGRASPTLRITMQTEGRREEVLWDGSGARPGARIALDARGGSLARLSFDARGDGAVEVASPRLLGTGERRQEPPGPTVSPPSRPSLLLYLVDTLRADHLGCYGHSLPTSPNIDAFAREAMRFSHVLAQSAWTKPATASILTGLDPPAHGALTLAGRIHPGVVTLAEMLKAHGYRTAAFVTNVNVRGEAGFRAGFDQYHYLPESESRPTLHLRADELNERVFGWLGESTPEPFFLYVHASDPHAPYRPPAAMHERVRPAGNPPPIATAKDPLREVVRHPEARSPEALAWLRSQYDGDIAATDDAFGALLRRLKELGLYDRILIVLSADHGEEFLEHGGFEHGRTLYQEQLRVPLIVRFPGGAPRGEPAGLARQIDVMPTVLRAVGLPLPAGLHGVPLQPDGEGPVEAFAETSLGGGDMMALTTPEGKVIHTSRRTQSKAEVYDPRHDPAERHDLAAERPILLGYARQSLTQRAVSVSRPPYGQGGDEILDDETARRLRALGYVDH